MISTSSGGLNTLPGAKATVKFSEKIFLSRVSKYYFPFLSTCYHALILLSTAAVILTTH